MEEETKIETEKSEDVRLDKPKKKKDKHALEIEKLTHLLGEEKEKSMRIQAEMMNFKRRKEEEVSNYKKYANEDILKDLIKVMDNFERAWSLETEENAEFLKGFKMISDTISKILAENGVFEIEALDKPFDPNFHQAVLTEAREGIEPSMVIEVLQKGYMYKDRVLRASMVKVSE